MNFKLILQSLSGPEMSGIRGFSQIPNQAWADQTAGFYYVVVDAMLKTGFAPDEIGKIGGGNFLRIFGEAVAK
jgi:microsomal dipeptidase-like Zn-dependent dipeptidase